MCTLDEFDPTDAVNHWMSEKNRKPSESKTRKQQEYFNGVFPEADQYKKANTNKIVSF